MSAPWPLSSGFTINTISNPYRRMMNTSGNAFRDHAGSMVGLLVIFPFLLPLPITKALAHAVYSSSRPLLITPFLLHLHLKQDLCRAALSFASETLKPNGHFVCKFYQGAEDKALEKILKKMFAKVHREKPESSRSVS